MSGSLAIISACGGCCGCKCKHRMSFFHLRTQPGSCQGRRVGWGVSMKSMGSLRGGAPHKYAGEGGLGGRGQQPSPPQLDPTIVCIHRYIHISIYPYIHISIYPYIHISIYPYIHINPYQSISIHIIPYPSISIQIHGNQ